MMAVFLVKTSMILLVAAVVTLMMRRSSAASRHVVWTTALLAVLMLPIATAVVPVIPIRVPDSGPAILSAAAAEIAPQPIEVIIDPVTHASRVVFTNASAAQPVTPNTARDLPWLQWLWLGGSALLLFRLALGFHARRRLAAQSAPCNDARLLHGVAVLSQRLGIRRRVTVFIAPSEMMPATWGLARPCLLLPPSASSWTDERLALVLTHELAHVVRFDAAAHGVAQASSALIWWNPLVWLASTRAQLERERACDDMVLRIGITPSAYAEALLSLSQTLPSPFSHRIALAMARPKRIGQRLSTILDPAQRRTGTSHICAALTSVVLAAQLPLAAAQLAVEPARQVDTILDLRSITGLGNEAGIVGGVPRPSLRAPLNAAPRPSAPARVTPGSTTSQQTSGPQPIPAGEFGAGAYRGGNGVTNPTRLHEVKPEYTDEARKAGLTGIVMLEAVIGSDGTVTDVRVTKSLDKKLGLDAKAMESVRQTPFAPCTLNERPVPCLVVFELQFSLPPETVPAGDFGAGAYRPVGQAGVKLPVRTNSVHPQYTPEALREKIQGTVELELIVRADGTVGDVRVRKSLDKIYGLDDQAIRAARMSTFTPGTVNGVASPFLVVFEETFRLK